MATIAGIVGIIGICGFITILLLVPLGYSILAVIFNFVFMAIAGFNNPLSWFGIAISCLIVILFYYNFKIVTFLW